MKNKNKKIAKQIIELEKEISLGKNVKSNEEKIEIIMTSLNFLDLMEVVGILEAYNKKIDF